MLSENVNNVYITTRVGRTIARVFLNYLRSEMIIFQFFAGDGVGGGGGGIKILISGKIQWKIEDRVYV